MAASFHADDDALEEFSDDVGSLWCRPIAVLDSPPGAFTFLRGVCVCMYSVYYIGIFDYDVSNHIDIPLLPTLLSQTMFTQMYHA